MKRIVYNNQFMAVYLGEKRIKYVVTDCDYTWYTKTPELDSKIWDPIEEAQIRFLLAKNKLIDADYPQFKQRFHEIGEKKGYYQAFLDLGGTVEEFEEFVKGVDTSQHLSFDPELAEAVELLASETKLFVFSGAPLTSIEKVIDALITEERRRLISGFIGKEILDALGYQKTDSEAYNLMIEDFGINPAEAIMIDDLSRSLVVAQMVGLSTLHINPEAPAQLQGNELSLPALKQIFDLLNVQ